MNECFVSLFYFYMENRNAVLYNKKDCGFRVPKVILEAVFCVFIKPSVQQKGTDYGKNSDDYSWFRKS